jgi:hypothetical protein
MKKANKPAPKTPARKAFATKKPYQPDNADYLARRVEALGREENLRLFGERGIAKPKAKSSSKYKPRKAQGQAQLLPIVERLAQSAERLA